MLEEALGPNKAALSLFEKFVTVSAVVEPDATKYEYGALSAGGVASV